MAFIETVPLAEAAGAVREMYERNQARAGYVPNYAKVFSLRPGVNAAWGGLVGSVRANMSARRYALVTLAAARALRSSYCSLAHARILHESLLGPGQLEALTTDSTLSGLEPAELAAMEFAERVARDASSVTAGDVGRLREHGLTDAEIFDVAAAAAARCFFSKLLDALGAEPDAALAGGLDERLRERLSFGRPPSEAPLERL